jgi:hypothetical protein
MSEDLIRYDILTQEALRGVIRKVLEETARVGLPGEHHFFITFATAYPGVKLSRKMQERFPTEMTIVIQHMFWNLEIGDTAFEIDLSFDDQRERLRVPWASIRGFFDPSVKFALQFDLPAAAGEPAKAPKEVAAPPPRTRKGPGLASVPSVKPGKSGSRPAAVKSGEEAGAQVVSLDAFRKKD